MKQRFLLAVPNPFSFLDHEGIPAGTFPLDPIHHSTDRRWVGATVDRSPGPDGLPRTRPLPQEGDLTAARKVKGADGTERIERVHVDRAPMKRICFAHDLSQPHKIPDSAHYRLGFREGSLFAGDADTAKHLQVKYVPPAEALKAAAAKAIKDWEQTYGEPPDIDAWPEPYRVAAGLTESDTNAGAAA